MLTMLADDYHSDAASIVHTIETYLNRIKGDRLPTLYLIDSIVKNVGKDYVDLFSRNLPDLFAKVFMKADEKTKNKMYNLRTTWDTVFPSDKLAILDARIKSIDPGWPVARVAQFTTIHVNPEFIKGGSNRGAAVKGGDVMREKILKEKKVLLELQKKKVELELLQTKKDLEKEQRKLDSFTTTIKGGSKSVSNLTDSTNLTVLERIQPTSSVWDIESENSKKLKEVSIRDPRRKSRHVEVSSGSPLSGSSSPLPSKTPVSDCSSLSPRRDNSDDSRDRPPKKKSRTKEKKRLKDKDSVREHKKIYKPKISESSSKNNGHSYKSSNKLNNRNYGDTDNLPTDEVISNKEVTLTDGLLPATFGCNLLRKSTDVASVTMSSDTSRSSASEDVKMFSESGPEEEKEDFTKQPSDVDCRLSGEIGQSLSTSATVKSTSKKYRDPRLPLDGTLVSDICTDVPVVERSKPDKLLHVAHSSPVRSSNVNFDDGSLISSNINSAAVNQANDLNVNNLELELIEGINKSEEVNCNSRDRAQTEDFTVESITHLNDEVLDVSDNSRSDSSTKTSSSKRKFDSDDDNEHHKKRLLAELQGNESHSPMSPSPLDVSSTVSETVSIAADENSGSSLLVAPPPPCIPPMVPLSVPLNDLECNMESENDVKSLKHQSDIVSSQPGLVTTEETGKDVDLRLLLPRPVDISKDEVKLERPSEPLMEDIPLFGGKDIDYRQKPPQGEFNLPSPPPAPVIGNLQEATSKKSWAQIKDRKSEDRSSSKVKNDRWKRLSITPTRPSPQGKHSSHRNSEAHCNFLIQEAEEQLRNGNITFPEYNKMLQEVVSINEERILNEAKARYSKPPDDDESSPASPISESFNSFDTNNVNTEQVDEIEPQRRPLDNRISDRSMDQQALFHSAQAPYGRDWADGDNRFGFPDHRVWRDGGDPSLSHQNFPRFPVGPPLQPSFTQFVNPNMNFQQSFRPRMPRDMAPSTHLPPADPELLRQVENDRMDVISIGRQKRQVRFYGSTAVVMMSWDDPREIIFPSELRCLFIDERHEYMLQLGDGPKEIMLDGFISHVQLGTPTRELYVDNKYYSIQFGGMASKVLICGRLRSVRLGGPPPMIRIGLVKRTDLVAGTVSLYVNAKDSFSFYLDAKPQKFFIDGESCVLQFADSLRTVLINGVPVPLVFGGYPVPVMFRGVQCYLRLTPLPAGIIPGQISITNMENYAQPTPSLLPPPPLPVVEPVGVIPAVFLPPQGTVTGRVQQQPADLLTNLMTPVSVPPSGDKSYSVEQPTIPLEDTASQSGTASTECKNLNVKDLFQKLLQIGLVHTTPSDTSEVKQPVEIDSDFSKPETLKVPRPGLVTKLYSGIQCSSCGIRFPPEGTKMYSRHLDWHFRQYRREKHSTRKPQCRGWYYDLANWMQYQELDDVVDNDPDHLAEAKEEEVEEDIPSVAVGHRKDVECQVCREKFEEFFNHETEEWHARNAVLVEDVFYHPLCYEEYKTKKDSNQTEINVPTEEEEIDEGLPVEDPSTIEVIELDDTEVPSPTPSTEGDVLPLLGPDKAESPDVIAVDDTSDSKSDLDSKLEHDNKETKKEDSDDDILDIIPIERKIESYELLDDDDDEDNEGDHEKIDKINEPVETSEGSKPDIDDKDDEEFDFTKVTIKQEKDRERLVVENSDSNLPTYTAHIDGNIVHETVAPLVVPGRIKINIHRSAKQSDGDVEQCSDSNDAIALSQPPPPGEETIEPPQTVKPRLAGKELTPRPPVNQGVELSGLCSIM